MILHLLWNKALSFILNYLFKDLVQQTALKVIGMIVAHYKKNSGSRSLGFLSCNSSHFREVIHLSLSVLPTWSL